MNKRSHIHKKADSSASNPVLSQFQSRPFIAQAQPQPSKPLTQTETENREFQQQKFEATKLKLQAKYGTITPEGHEQLTVLQAKMSGLLQRRLEHASSKGSNFANIPISRPDAPSQQARPDTPTPVQAKVTIGQPGDMYEREADVMAREVMSMPAVAQPEMGTPEHTHSQVRSKPLAAKITPYVQQKAMPQSDRGLQGAGEFESRLRRSKGGGSPLPDEVQAFMAPRFGANLSDRRVHTGREAVQMNQAIGALAFTHGKDIYYGAGKSPRNDHLTAHELAHTFQQTGSAVQRSPMPEAKATNKLKDDLTTLLGNENQTTYEDFIKAISNYSERIEERKQVINDTEILNAIKTKFSRDQALAIVGTLQAGMYKWRQPNENSFLEVLYNKFEEDKGEGLKNMQVVERVRATMNCWELILYSLFLLGRVTEKQIYNQFQYKEQAQPGYTPEKAMNKSPQEKKRVAEVNRKAAQKVKEERNKKIWSELGYSSSEPLKEGEIPPTGKLVFYVEISGEGSLKEYPEHVTLSLGGGKVASLWDEPNKEGFAQVIDYNTFVEKNFRMFIGNSPY